MEHPTVCKRTPLYNVHLSLQGKMVPFAGYEMPVQYPLGILKEHLHTRRAAGLFDISHMGQVVIEGGADILKRIEQVMPGEFQELAPGQIRYSFLLNEQGGVIDDLMVTRPTDPADKNKVFVIINASGRETDMAEFRKRLPDCKVTLLEDHALLALQGPEAANVLARYCDAPQKLSFMRAGSFVIKDIGLCHISRSGYTGEDGFEISVPNATVEAFARSLLAQPEVQPIGLGARDSLRLEAGLCLYGHELDTTTTPIEAGLVWAIGKRRRAEGGFVAANIVQKQLVEGIKRQRVGIRPEGRALAREHTEVQDGNGLKIGEVCSGGFGPSVDGPVCMAYVETGFAKVGTVVSLIVRGNALPAKIVPLPFVPHHYKKG
jgi:aminomethyltransferase